MIDRERLAAYEADDRARERRDAIVQQLRDSEIFYDGVSLDLDAVLSVIARLTMRVEDLERKAER